MMRGGLAVAFFLVGATAAAAACVGSDPSTTSPDADGGVPDGSSGIDARVDDASSDTGGGIDANEAGPFDANYYGHLELWLEADDGVVLEDGGAAVAEWKDHSTKARTTTVPASNADCQGGPTVVASAIHGLPVVRFNGATQCMMVSGDFKDFTNGLTVFAVYQPENCNSSFTGNSSALFDSYDNTGSNYDDGVKIGRNPAPANTASGDAFLKISNKTGGTGTVEITGGGSWVPTNAELVTFRLPAATSGAPVVGTAYLDGTFVTPNPNMPLTPAFNANRTTTYIGNGKGQSSGYGLYCGGIGELLVYSKALPDADRAAVEAHLKARWGL